MSISACAIALCFPQRLSGILAQALIKEAREIGYTRMVLDTARTGMEAAVRLYQTLGFEQIEDYHEVPKELSDRMLFMGLELSRK
jgi:ribosomal protein S18 acetylase RimI-like enzyme